MNRKYRFGDIVQEKPYLDLILCYDKSEHVSHFAFRKGGLFGDEVQGAGRPTVYAYSFEDTDEVVSRVEHEGTV
jgi:hypothetical protein